MVKLVITCDYELFGSSEGDVLNCLIRPTRDMLDLCEKYSARLTIFAEVCEYWAFLKYADRLKQDWGYWPHLEIEKQLKQAMTRGHDVQLHFHPQWLDAEYRDKRWYINKDYWRLPELAKEKGPKTLADLFIKGKQTLEDMLKPHDPKYRCFGFRSGGWNIQPEEDILQAMKAAGLKADSTVMPGVVKDSDFTKCDFSAVPDKDYWFIDKRVDQGLKAGGILELPVSTFRCPAFKFLLGDIKDYLFRSKHPPGCCGRAADPGGGLVGELFKRLSGRTVKVFDFSVLPVSQMIYGFKRESIRGRRLFILAGHSKSYTRQADFDRFLKRLSGEHKKSSELEFLRFRDLTDSLFNL